MWVGGNFCTLPITVVIATLPHPFLRGEWSGHLVARSEVETSWLCNFWSITIKEMWSFLLLSLKFFRRKFCSFVQRITLLGGGFAERQIFLIWIKLNLFSRKTFDFGIESCCVCGCSFGIFRTEWISDVSFPKPGRPSGSPVCTDAAVTCR